MKKIERKKRPLIIEEIATFSEAAETSSPPKPKKRKLTKAQEHKQRLKDRENRRKDKLAEELAKAKKNFDKACERLEKLLKRS